MSSTDRVDAATATVLAFAALACVDEGVAGPDVASVSLDIAAQPIEGGETLVIPASLEAGQLLVVDVDQEHADLQITLVDADGRTQTIANSPVSRSGRVMAAVDAGAATTIDIHVHSLEAAGYPGRVAGKVTVWSSKDSAVRRQAALRMSEAGYFNYQAERSNDSATIDSSRRRAAELYISAAEAWSRLGEHDLRGLSLYFAGKLIYDLYDWEVAADLFETAVESLGAGDQQVLMADAKQQLAAALIEIGGEESLDRAATLLQSAMTDYERLGEVYRVGQAENALGMVYYYRDDWVEAKDWFGHAAASFASVGEDKLAVRSFTNSAKSDEKLGRLVAASDTHAKALELADRSGDALDRASVLDNYADTHALLGNVQQALTLYQESADEFERLGDPVGRAKAVAGIGFVMYQLGEWESARRYATEALQLQQGGFERRPMFETLRYLGNAHRGLGDVDDAIAAHRQAEAVAAGGLERAQVRLELGEDFLAAGRYAEAGERFAEAGAIADELGITYLRAYADNGLGRSVLATDPEQGLDLLNVALARHLESDNLAGEAETHQALALVYQQRGDERSALAHAEQALEVIERLRVRVGNPRLVASFNGLSRPTYDLQIELLMRLAETADDQDAADYVNAALEVSERGRARALLGYLSAGWLSDPAVDDDPGESRYRQLTRELAELRYRRERAELDVGDTQGRELAALQAEIDRTITELTILEGALRRDDTSITLRPETLPAASIIELLESTGDGPPVLVLEFSLGPSASFLWAITDDGVTAHRLPAEAELNRLARRVHETTSAISAGGRGGGAPDAAAERLAAILLGPVADRLGDHRIVIVPDGALYFVPFAALPVRKDGGQRAALVDVADVSFLPSLMTLHHQRGVDVAPVERVAVVFANPVFGDLDPRWPEPLRAPGPTPTLVPVAKEDLPDSAAMPRQLSPLPWTAAEASAVAEIVPQEGDVMLVTGFDATVDAVLDAPLDEFRILHFATHGWADSAYPELSSLTFSRLDREGETRRSELQLPDIYRLRLNSDLVVLSACDTALGKYVPGEGVLGLTHAFMSAGSRRVVATLWQVSDRATARMMELFYEGMFAEGLSPGRALAEAQRMIKQDRRWRDPFYWAGFTLQGDWL